MKIQINMQRFSVETGAFWSVPLCCKSTEYCTIVSKEDSPAPLGGALVGKVLALQGWGLEFGSPEPMWSWLYYMVLHVCNSRAFTVRQEAEIWESTEAQRLAGLAPRKIKQETVFNKEALRPLYTWHGTYITNHIYTHKHPHTWEMEKKDSLGFPTRMNSRECLEIILWRRNSNINKWYFF